MQVKFGSHFTLSQPAAYSEFDEKFKTKGFSAPYVCLDVKNDAFTKLTAWRDEDDKDAEKFLQKKKINFTKIPTVEYIKEWWLKDGEDEQTATQLAQSYIDHKVITKNKSVPSLLDMVAQRTWDLWPAQVQDALIRNKPENL